MTSETLADVVAEMRELAADIESGNAVVGQTVWRNYADRIEAAAKRLREDEYHRGAEAREKFIYAVLGKPSNAAAMREALESIVKVGYPHNFQHEAPHIRGYCYEITDAINKCFAALAKPSRNCDRFDDLKSAQRHYIEHGCPKGLGMIVDGEIRKTPWKSQFEKWLFDKEEGETDGSK